MPLTCFTAPPNSPSAPAASLGRLPALLCFGVLFFAAAVGLARIHAQSAGVNQGGSPMIHAPADSSSMPSGRSGEAARVEQMRQAERQRRIVNDTAKLVELSNQLKADLDRTPVDQLSVASMRKVAEIEKIAHDLKQWMGN